MGEGGREGGGNGSGIHMSAFLFIFLQNHLQGMKENGKQGFSDIYIHHHTL